MNKAVAWNHSLGAVSKKKEYKKEEQKKTENQLQKNGVSEYWTKIHFDNAFWSLIYSAPD